MSRPRGDMKPAQVAVAAVALLAALLFVALVIQAGRRIYESIGPSAAVAAEDGSLYVVSHGGLHVFAPDGTLRTSVALQSLGLTKQPSGIALHHDGRVLLADPETALLHRCRLPQGPCEALDLGLHRIDFQKVVPLNSIKVAIDEAAQRYYVSDNSGHQVVIADFAGRVLDRSKRGTFWYPNHLFLQAPGELSVVDTNHHRIATLDVHDDHFGKVIRTVAAGSSDATRPGRQWPFDAAPLPDGRMAILVAADGMKDADLVVADGGARRRIDLGAASDPFDVEWWNGRLVVSDATHYRLVALDLEGRAAPGFPPAAFAQQLDRERDRPEFWRAVRLGAQVGLVIVPLAAILLLWRLGVPLSSARAEASSTRSAAAIGTAVGELACDPKFLARQRKVLALSAVALAIGLTGLVAVLGFRVLGSGAEVPWSRLALLGALLPAVLVLVPLAWRYTRRVQTETRLQSSAARLDVTMPSIAGSARTVSAPWRDVFWDGKTLLAGKALLSVRTPRGGEMFEREAFERLVLSHVPAANRISPGRLWTIALRAGNPQAIAIVALLVLWIAIEAARLARHL